MNTASSSYTFRFLFFQLLLLFLFCPFSLFYSVFQYLASLGDQQEKDSAKTRPILSISQSPFLVTCITVKREVNLVEVLRKPRGSLNVLKGIKAGHKNCKKISVCIFLQFDLILIIRVCLERIFPRLN